MTTHLPTGARAIAISGSLRTGSTNTALIHLAARVAPPHLQVEVIDWIDQLPYYNPDLEADLPDAARRWRQAVVEADALVLGLPEYNFGASALAKNAIDWLTRPIPDYPLRGKVIAMLTSAGKGGGAQAQLSLGSILGLLGNEVIHDPVVQIVRGSTRIDADGVADDEIIELVTQKMVRVAEAIGGLPGVRPG